MKVEVIVLNYNGGELFIECLSSLVESVKRSRHACKLVILDNLSADGSDREAEKKFPIVEVVRASANRVLCSYNDYLYQSKCDIALLLNNDIRVDKNFIDPLIDPIEKNSEIFMVTPKCLSFEGSRYEGGRCQSRIKFGLFWSACIFPGYEREMNHPNLTMAAGFGAFDRKKFLELGGYDDLYLPGRLEDNDICFRAWRRGWKCLYEPKSVVYHKGASSFNKAFGVNKTLVLGHRNSFLFLWKNIRDTGYLLEHILFVIPRVLFACVMGKCELAMGFGEALGLFKQAWAKRRESRIEKSLRSDREIFGLVK